MHIGLYLTDLRLQGEKVLIGDERILKVDEEACEAESYTKRRHEEW